MKTSLGATIFLNDREGDQGVRVERVKDERSSTKKDHYFVLKVGDLTVFIEPVSMDQLIRALKTATKRRAFDDVLK